MSVSGSGSIDSGKAAVVRAEVDVPNLYVKRIIIGADGEMDRAILGALPQGEDGEDIRIEDARSLIEDDEGHDAGRVIKITGDAGSGTKQALFHGRIMSIHYKAGGRMEDIEFVALGLDHELRSERIFGVYARESGGDAQHLQAVPCVFNPDGRPNKHAKDLNDPLGNTRIVFELDDVEENDNAANWTGADMARYAATAERKDTVNDEPRVFDTDDADIGGELSGFTPYSVNIEGEDIWTALVRIANVCSHSIVFEYGQSREDSRLRFFPRNVDEANETKQFEFPEAGGPVEIEDRGRVISSIDMETDWAGVVNQVDAVAPPKLYESQWQMKRGWKLADQQAALGGGNVASQVSNFLRETDPETSSNWERFKYVGRRYILNETGRDDVADGDTSPFSFAAVFGSDKYATRFRPFRNQRVEKDESGKPKPIEVRVEWGGSQPDNFRIGDVARLLEDRAGIYFYGRPLVSVPRALDTGSAANLFPSAVRVTAVVEGDQAAPFGVFGVGDQELRLPTFGLVRLDDGFRQDNKGGGSDASNAAQALVDQAAEELSQPREVGTVVCPYITNQFKVGDAIDSIDGRGISMQTIIMKIAWDFDTQTTEFALTLPGLDTETHAAESETFDGADVGAHTDGGLSAMRFLLEKIGNSADPQSALFAAMHDPEGRRILQGKGL